MSENNQITASLDELIFILEKQISLHRSLCDLLNEEFQHMVDIDFNGLAEASHAKEVLVGEIWNLEQIRIEKTQKLWVDAGQPNEAPTLLEIASISPENYAVRLRAGRESLTLLMKASKELNSRNMEFASTALSRIEQLKKNVLGIESQASKENYNQGGIKQPTPEQGGRLLSVEA